MFTILYCVFTYIHIYITCELCICEYNNIKFPSTSINKLKLTDCSVCYNL